MKTSDRISRAAAILGRKRELTMESVRLVVVTDCNNCPFSNGEWSHCVHPDTLATRGMNDRNVDSMPPDWCPLRSEGVKVELAPNT